ncbi:hypothetical protein DRO38_02645 [Candidatus Bathyarchaeota archaeon]|nr:MAG: hypothetical protein DRO38_02645 [Candidatus Bathyarchaeota archaeon]
MNAMNDEFKDSCTVQEAAQLLGVSPDTIRRRIRLGILSAHRKGKQYLINRSELEKFMHDNGNVHGSVIPGSRKDAFVQDMVQTAMLKRELEVSQKENEMLRERIRELEEDKAFLLDQIREKDKLIGELAVRALPKPRTPLVKRIRHLFRRTKEV